MIEFFYIKLHLTLVSSIWWGCGGGWSRGAGYWTTNCLILVGAELFNIIPVETTGTETFDWSEVNTGVISSAGAGVSKTTI